MGSYKERKDKHGKIVGYSAQIRIKGHRPEHGSFKSKTKMRTATMSLVEDVVF